MRAVNKLGDGGYQLTRAHAKPPATSEEAKTRWTSFPNKDHVKSALLAEQYQLCCYSELRADQEGLGFHIEHGDNRSQNPARTFDCANLAASALRSEDLRGLNRDEVFGGHALGKQRSCDMVRLVSCHQPDCARYFAYLSDGRVVPTHALGNVEIARARYTIDLLNLNSPFLITRRRQWWAELDEFYQEHLNKAWSVSDLAAIDLIPMDGAVSRFFSLTRQFFGSVAEQVIHIRAPSLA